MASEPGALPASSAQSSPLPQAHKAASSPPRPKLPSASSNSSGNMRVKLIYHVPGVVTSIFIDVGAALASNKGGFLELSFRDAVAEVVPSAKGAGKESVLLSPQRAAPSSSDPGASNGVGAAVTGTSSAPSIPDRFAPPRRNPRYANIIEQLEKKYGGRNSMRSEEDEEEVEEEDSSAGGGDEENDDAEGGEEGAVGADKDNVGDEVNGGDATEGGNSNSSKKKGKRKRRIENADYYDSEDSFIDDEEIIEKIEVNYKMKAVKTKHSGFFVSSGALETLNPVGGFAVDGSQEDSRGSGAKKRSRVEGAPKKRSVAPSGKPPSAASKSALAALQAYTDAKGLKFTSRLYKELRAADDTATKNGDSEWFITSLVKLFAPEGLTRKALEHKLEKLRAKASSETEPRTSLRMQAINEASSHIISALRPMLMSRIASLVSGSGSSNNSSSSNGGDGITRSDLFDLWTELWRDESILALFDAMRAKCEENARVETLRRDAAKSAKLEREKQQQATDKEPGGTADASAADGSAATLAVSPSIAASGNASSSTTKPGSKAEEAGEGLPLEERMRHMMLCEISRQLRKICEEAAELLWAVLPPAPPEPATAPEVKPPEGKVAPNDKAAFTNELLKIAKKVRQPPSGVVKIDASATSTPSASFSPKRPVRPSLGGGTEHLVIPVPISADAAIASALLQVAQKKKPKRSLEGGTPKTAPAPGNAPNNAPRSEAAATPLSPSAASATSEGAATLTAAAIADDGSPSMGTVFDDPPEFDPRDFMIFNSIS